MTFLRFSLVGFPEILIGFLDRRAIAPLEGYREWGVGSGKWEVGENAEL